MIGDIKPIRFEADYEAALAEVERLWGAKLGTPEGDRLDLLVTLIDAYETEHYPMDPPDPIDAIKESRQPVCGPRPVCCPILDLPATQRPLNLHGAHPPRAPAKSQ